MDAEHVEGYTLEVAVEAAFQVAAAVAASLAGVVDVDWSVVEALEVQAVDLFRLVRAHPEAEVLPVLLCKVGLSAAKGH